MEALEKWFLTAKERGNPATDIDRRREGGAAWTGGNRAEALVDGSTYFQRLYEQLSNLKRGDLMYFTDWRGDPDELLDGPGTELGKVLADLARKGVKVRGLVWRSHPHQEKFSEQEHVELGKIVNEAGGQILLDERVRRGGSHHQKLVLTRHPGREDEDVAFVGGIDLCHGRRDDAGHHGDPQRPDIDKVYGPRPPWHDVQLEIRGPAVGDLAETFRERWHDPTPLDHRNPWRAWFARLARQPRRAEPLPPMLSDPAPVGTSAVQVLRTYPSKRPPFPFAPMGERSIARAYAKAFRRARSLIYLEDQYLWSEDVAQFLAAALRRSPDLRVVMVVPRFPERDGRVSGPPSRIGQQRALERVRDAGGDRVAVYDLENEAGQPIYVHSKVCIVDDVWAVVGSDNMARRSWTHDSELSCAILDEKRDSRRPVDPGGTGDGARVFARELRMQLWQEHLGNDVSEQDLLDPEAGFELWQRRAAALENWHRGGRNEPRPRGRVRVHDPKPVSPWAQWWAAPIYRLVVDPDGRPASMRRARRF